MLFTGYIHTRPHVVWADCRCITCREMTVWPVVYPPGVPVSSHSRVLIWHILYMYIHRWMGSMALVGPTCAPLVLDGVNGSGWTYMWHISVGWGQWLWLDLHAVLDGVNGSGWTYMRCWMGAMALVGPTCGVRWGQWLWLDLHVAR